MQDDDDGGCHWTMLDYPAFRYQDEYFSNFESCLNDPGYLDMMNGPEINKPILKIKKNGNKQNINQSVIDAVITFGTET